MSAEFDTSELDQGIASQGERGGEPTVLDRLAEQGVDSRDLAEIQQGYMRQRDYTHKTQEMADIRRELADSRQQMAAMWGRMSAQAPPKSNTESYLDSADDGSQVSKEAKSVLRNALAAHEQDVLSKVGAAVAPLHQQIRSQQAREAVDEYTQQSLVPMYGKGVSELINRERANITSALVQGYSLNVEHLLRQKYPDEMKKLNRQQVLRESQGDAGSEGFRESRYATPPFSGGRSRPVQSAVTGDMAWDPQKAAREIRHAMRGQLNQ